jgi:hypothetical protein
MLDYKIAVRRRIKAFNDDSLPDFCSLQMLTDRRTQIGKGIFGKLGSGTNIEAPLFCTWGCNTFIVSILNHGL